MGKLVGSPAGCHPFTTWWPKQAELLEIMEKLEGYCPEGTLQYWLLEHMYETLAQGEEDTVGVCSACLM